MKKKPIEEEIDALMQRPYIREIVPDAEGGFVGAVRELPGCLTQGESIGETWANLEEAMRLWFEVALEEGDTIPEPYEERRYSGRLLLRLPKFLHREIAKRAEEEEASINTYLTALIAVALGVTARLGSVAGVWKPEDLIMGEPKFEEPSWGENVIPIEEGRRVG